MISIPIWFLVALCVLSFFAICFIVIFCFSMAAFMWEAKNVKYRGVYDTNNECTCKPREGT